MWASPTLMSYVSFEQNVSHRDEKSYVLLPSKTHQASISPRNEKKKKKSFCRNWPAIIWEPFHQNVLQVIFGILDFLTFLAVKVTVPHMISSCYPFLSSLQFSSLKPWKLFFIQCFKHIYHSEIRHSRSLLHIIVLPSRGWIYLFYLSQVGS